MGQKASETIVNLSQGSKSIREYAVEFKRNIGLLDFSNEAILMQFFISGLYRDIAEGVYYPPYFPIVGNSHGRGN